MALVYKAGLTETTQPSSPSFSNPDMILPYDPRLRDSGSTQMSVPEVGTLNEQMSRSANAAVSPAQSPVVASNWPGAAEHFARPSMPGGWQTESDLRDAMTLRGGQKANIEGRQEGQLAHSGYTADTSFLNLDRYSMISTGSGANIESSATSPPVPRDEAYKESDEETNARNDFARAEEILANAKKRLTTMESNLTRARSINVGRSPSAASNTPDGNSPSTSRFPARSNGWAVSAAKLRHANYTQANLGPGHTRVFSENSIPKTNLDLVRKVGDQDRVRSSSAMGALRTEDLHAISEEHRSPLRGFGRLEPLKEDELLTPSDSSSHRATSRTGLDRLNDLPAKARSNVQLRDLREQMEDLRDKLDVLKRRTREDSLRRSSMQYLKSPSPFTDADAWTKSQTGSPQSSKADNATPTAVSPIVASVSSPTKPTESSPKLATQEIAVDEAKDLPSPSSMIAGPRGVIEGALSSIDAQIHDPEPQKSPSHRPNLSGSLPALPQSGILEQSAFDPWSPSSERAEMFGGELPTLGSEKTPLSAVTEAKPMDETAAPVAAVEDNEAGSEGDDHMKDLSPIEASGSDSTPATELSGDVAGAAAPEVDAAEAAANAELSHEERPDAFDYENFVISSTMGTYSRQGRRSRSTSRSSTSTIGPDAYMDTAGSPLPAQSHMYPYQNLHQHARHGSASSASSIGTFATANSRSASRLQGGSRAAIRQAASREALGELPGFETGGPTGVYDEESNPSTVSGSDVERTPGGRPLSMASFSRPRPPSTIFRGASASKAGFRASYVAGGSGERGAQARSQILSVLMADPHDTDSSRATPALLQRISPADEALVRAVIEGMQRTCGQLALADERDDPDHVTGLRRRLEAARRALEGEGLDTLLEDGEGWDSGEEREFMAL